MTESKQEYGFTMLTPNQIKMLPTPRLLAAYKSHRRYIVPLSYGADLYRNDKKQYDEACKYLDSIKAELDTREHVGPNRVTDKTKDRRLRLLNGRRK